MRSSHTLASPINHILKSGHHMGCSHSVFFFNLGTFRAVYQEDFASPIGQPCLWRRCFSLRGCMQWEEDMVWARQGTQIDSAARLMTICSERCREAGGAVQGCVIVLGEYNAPPNPPFVTLSLTLRHSSPSPFVVLLIRTVSSLSPSSAFSSLAASLTLPQRSSSKMPLRLEVDLLWQHNFVWLKKKCTNRANVSKCANLFKKTINTAAEWLLFIYFFMKFIFLSVYYL